MSYEQALKERYAEVRGRLRPAVVRSKPLLIAPPPVVIETPKPQALAVDAATVATARSYSSAFKRILAEVTDKHGVGVADIMSTSRYRNVVQARQEACFRLRMETNLSLPQIGKRLGKDHSTVLHSIRRYLNREGMMATEGKIKRWPVWGKGGWH